VSLLTPDVSLPALVAGIANIVEDRQSGAQRSIHRIPFKPRIAILRPYSSPRKFNYRFRTVPCTDGGHALSMKPHSSRCVLGLLRQRSTQAAGRVTGLWPDEALAAAGELVLVGGGPGGEESEGVVGG